MGADSIEPFGLTLGPFYAGHLLLAASAMVFIAGVIMPATNRGNLISARL